MEPFLNVTDNSASTVNCRSMDTGYVISTVYLLLALPGIVVYTFTLIIIIIKYGELKSTFYMLAVALGVADVLPLCLIAFYGVPCILTCSHVIPFISPFVFGWLTHVCWYMQISLIFVVSLNRFVAMTAKGYKRYDSLFGKRNMLIYISLATVFSLSMIVMMNLSSIFSTFDYRRYYFGFDLNINSTLAQTSITANLAINDLAIGCTALVYLVTWISLKRKQNNEVESAFQSLTTLNVKVSPMDGDSANGNGKKDYANSIANNAFAKKGKNSNVNSALANTRKKAETKIFWQSVVVTSALTVFQVSFYVLPLLVSSNFALTLITSVVYIVVCSMNGYLNLLLNSVIRTETKLLIYKLFGKKAPH